MLTASLGEPLHACMTLAYVCQYVHCILLLIAAGHAGVQRMLLQRSCCCSEVHASLYLVSSCRFLRPLCCCLTLLPLVQRHRQLSHELSFSPDNVTLLMTAHAVTVMAPA